MSGSKLHVKEGDTVMVITGKHKGKKGKVIESRPREKTVLVEGVNKAKRHQKPTQQTYQGGIIEKEAPVHASNVLLVCTKCNKPSRVSKKEEGDKKVRRCKSCDTALD